MCINACTDTYTDVYRYDLVRAMPGGVAAIAKVVSELHARGVKVLL